MAAFEIKVSNIGENIDKAIICCGYVIDTDGLHYIDDGKTVDIPTMKSYNEHKGN